MPIPPHNIERMLDMLPKEISFGMRTMDTHEITARDGRELVLIAAEDFELFMRALLFLAERLDPTLADRPMRFQ